MYDGDIAATLVTEDAIRAKTAELATKIGNDYPEGGTDLLLVGVLKGAVMFMTDLARLPSYPSPTTLIARSGIQVIGGSVLGDRPIDTMIMGNSPASSTPAPWPRDRPPCA